MGFGYVTGMAFDPLAAEDDDAMISGVSARPRARRRVACPPAEGVVRDAWRAGLGRRLSVENLDARRCTARAAADICRQPRGPPPGRSEGCRRNRERKHESLKKEKF